MSSISVNTITDASGGATTSINGFTPSVSNMAGRNRIINGDMRIDQRNAGAAVTLDGSESFPVDRFPCGDVTDGAFTAQQVSDAPVGFLNSLKCTITSADASLTTTQAAYCKHNIEGLNVSDFNWGTANAKTITLSFWVKSSLTGTFGGSLRNYGATRSYPYSYTISAANTWEYKTITIAGDTTGTWLVNNGEGLNVQFSLGAGPDRLGTAGAWVSSNNVGAIGQTNLISTNGATWQITGVQLEEGSVATPFEHRQYGQELVNCLRYFWKVAPILQCGGETQTQAGNTAKVLLNFPVPMRASPSGSVTGNMQYYNGTSWVTATTTVLDTNVWSGAIGINVGSNGLPSGSSTSWNISANGQSVLFSSEL